MSGGGGAERAYSRVRQAIVEGTYGPGQRLVEQRIAEEFSLSRTPVREALRRLHAEGLVEVVAHRGAVVRPLTVADVADLYELRARLEGYAAERAALRAEPAQLARIDAAVDAYDRAVADSAPGEVTSLRALKAANDEFHEAIVDAAGHARLASMLGRTVDHPLVFRAFQRYDRESLERSALFHRLLRDAITRGEAVRAGRLMEEHVASGRDALLAEATDLAELEDDGCAVEEGAPT